MTWDPSKPADTTKLRLAPGLIRVNWNALQQGGVPYVKLQLAEQGSNPTRADNTGWLYTKEVSSQTELFYEDDRNPAKVIQLTNNGGIGVTTQLLYGSAVITSGTYQNTQNAFCSAWARVDSSGSLIDAYGINASSRPGTGQYTVTFSPALTSSTYCIVATARETSGPDHNRVAMITATSTTSASIRIQRVDQDGSFENCSFYVAVFGGR